MRRKRREGERDGRNERAQEKSYSQRTTHKCMHTGTKKYPDEASYSQFLSAHGGKYRQKIGEERREGGNEGGWLIFKYTCAHREQQCLHGHRGHGLLF